MRGLAYQFKSVWKDKFCMMSFVLPIIVALALRFSGTVDLSSVAEFHFGVLENELTARTVCWLERYGTVTAYGTQEELVAAVNEPSTNVIGVEACGSGIRTMVSGDEVDIFRQTADTLPVLYEERGEEASVEVTVYKRPDIMAGLQNIFPVMTLIIAMFMGCTFNAMNMIAEKENGVDLINQILPMARGQYMLQKIFVGFAFGCLSSVVTAGICFHLSVQGTLFMLALIILSAFVAALAGLFIGKFSENLMVGVACVKIMLIIFMAVPLLAWLLGGDGVVSILCYLVPSSATFEGMMELAKDGQPEIAKDIFILAAHCIIWFCLYLSIAKGQEKKSGGSG